MTEQADRVVSEFSDSLEQAQSQLKNLHTVLSRTLQALAQHGVQLSVDLDSMTRAAQQEVDAAQKRSRRVVQQLSQQRELVRTVALITSSLELDQVLAEVMDTVIHLTGAERAYLMLRDKDTQELSVRAARNWGRETISEDDTIFSRSIVNAALEQMEPIIATNAQGDVRFQAMKSVVQHGLRSILCIPLSMHGRVVGVLYADNRIEQGIFSNDDIPLLTAFGTQAAIAIENARMFTRVKADLREAQRELQVLKIQIDQHKVNEQVNEITESEYFERLSEAARALRQTRQNMQNVNPDQDN
jgi:GAF domain-containing protein